MAALRVTGNGTKKSRLLSGPWQLKTPPGTSDYTMHKDVKDDKEIFVCIVGKTVLHYDARCLNDLHAMLKKNGDPIAIGWIELGSTDEQKPAKEKQ